MTPTAVPQLRPLTLAELLDQAIRLYRRNFLTLIAIVAIVYMPLALAETAIAAFTAPDLLAMQQRNVYNYTPGTPLFPTGYWINIAGNLVLGALSLVFIGGLGTAAVTRAVADNYLGTPIGITSAYRNIAGRWGKLVRVLLYTVVVSIALMLWWFLVPCIGWISGGGMYAFFVMVMTPLFAAIAVLEGHGARATVRRAWDLARRRFWWLLGFMLVLMAFSLIIIAGPTTLVTLLLEWLTSNFLPAEDPTTALVVQTLVSQTVSVVLRLIYQPLALVCYTLLYFDLRIRTEGLDLALQTASAPDLASPSSLEPPPASSTMIQLLAQAPAPETRGWFTINEFIYFVGLTVGAGVLYLGAVGIAFAVVAAQLAR